jgi:hypothetical protein
VAAEGAGAEIVEWWMGKKIPHAHVAPWATRPMAGQGVVDKGELGKEWPDQLGETVELLGRVCLDGACRERDPLALGAPSIFDESPGDTVNA